MRPSIITKRKSEASEGLPARVGLALAGWSERWFPDPLVIALLGVIVVFVIGVPQWGEPHAPGFRVRKELLGAVPFTMQMIMVIVGGHVIASIPVVVERSSALPDCQTALAVRLCGSRFFRC